MSDVNNDIKNGIFQILEADTQLKSMLAVNNDPYAPDAPASSANSIVGVGAVSGLTPPFITIKSDIINMVGRTHLRDAFALVRCYNSKDKTFYTINSVLSRVQKLIDDSDFQIAGYGVVEVRWETTREESQDDGLNMNYREAQFRIQIT